MVEHQRGAMSVLAEGKPLKPREGQFVGGIAFYANPLTEKQRNCLVILLDKHGLPSLTDGGDA
ncbi:hypothetical protein [Sphingomonas sp. Leaf208]|uniref:hypothetical protein n=1 Tax=Sphingomonas sp. Leaf208 TaxID=1735679 RepID=UPI000AC873EA|nr:hypothetical protein [Sphingomonas sp. Leaf208]